MNKDRIGSIMFYLCTLCGYTGICVFWCICDWIDNVKDLKTLIMGTISVVVLLAFNVFMFVISKKVICEELECKEEELTHQHEDKGE